MYADVPRMISISYQDERIQNYASVNWNLLGF